MPYVQDWLRQVSSRLKRPRLIQPNSVPSFRFLGIFGASVAITLVGMMVLPHKSLSELMFKDNPKEVLDEAWQIVNRSYVDPQFNHVNWRQVRQELLSPTYTTPEAAYTALKAALKKLDDPYTRFLDPEEFQALSHHDIDGELSGVGLQIENNGHGLTVVKALAQTPAFQAGIQAGDGILAIDSKEAHGMTAEMAARLIRGPKNTTVTLQIRRGSQPPFLVTLTRQDLKIPVVYSAVRQEGSQRIGYIRLEEFSGHAAEQMRQAIADLNQQQVDRFVLDLRGNPGGLLEQETAIARMWLNQGLIVRIVDRHGDAEKINANHTAMTDRPLVILVDGGSASASEILTGALKDHHRAVTVGTQTFGKALVQSVNPLSDGSGINVTIAHYFTPTGLDINHRGIKPDVVVPLTKEKQQELLNHPNELGTDQDPQYKTAIVQGIPQARPQTTSQTSFGHR